MTTADRETLRRNLEELHRRTARSIRTARGRTALARGIDRALPLVVVIPVLWILVRLVDGGPRVDAFWIVATTVLIPLSMILARILAAALRDVTRPAALAVLDRELDLEDRLQTADEFLVRGEANAFVEAALEDAAAFVDRARGCEARLPHEVWRLNRLTAGWLGVGLAALLVALWIGSPALLLDGETTPPDEPARDAVAVAMQEEADRPTPPAATGREPRPPIAETPPREFTGTEAGAQRDRAGEIADAMKESSGKTGEGRSSDAESTSGASESRGVPSSQAQKSEAAQKPDPKSAKKRKPKPPADDPRRTDEEQEENSGSTAGKGSSRGSNRNPAVSRWSSKDQVTTEDDQELEDDQDAEDEEENQESRGGVQPHLRDRKPPVSRDLRIGFGNQPDPDANGRGGPSEMKKSRGTASLVLGVPIPDRVKGQPNPGKTKITQERVEPRAEDSAAIEATAREPRRSPIGPLHRHEFAPWMRTLVREYFLTLRQRRDES